jgi:hypothetical protein
MSLTVWHKSTFEVNTFQENYIYIYIERERERESNIHRIKRAPNQAVEFHLSPNRNHANAAPQTGSNPYTIAVSVADILLIAYICVEGCQFEN